MVAPLTTAGVSDEVAQELQMPVIPQILEDVEEPMASRFATLRDPSTPDQIVMEQHNLTHFSSQPWCKMCVESGGHDSPHREQSKIDAVVPQLQFDYGCMENGGPLQIACFLVGADTSSGAIHVLCGTRTSSPSDLMTLPFQFISTHASVPFFLRRSFPLLIIHIACTSTMTISTRRLKKHMLSCPCNTSNGFLLGDVLLSKCHGPLHARSSSARLCLDTYQQRIFRPVSQVAGIEARLPVSQHADVTSWAWAMFYCQNVTDHCTLAGSADLTTPHPG